MPAWIPTVALLLGSAGPVLPVMVEGACDDRSALQQRLAALVPADAPLTSVRLSASHREASAWQGTLVFEVDGTQHERSLSAESCAALYEASALVIGLTVQPPIDDVEEDAAAVPETPIVDPAPSASTPAAASPSPLPPTTEVAEPPAPAAESRVPPQPWPRAQLQAGAGMAVGVVHPLHPLVTGGAALAGRRWAAGLDLLYLPPLTAEIAPQTRATVQLGALQARGCPVWRLADARVALPLCAGVATGVAWGRGEGEAIVGRRGRETWVSLLTGPRLELHARWGGVVWLATELVVPLLRLNFVIGQGGAACCEAPVGAMISLGGGWSLGRQRN